MNQASLYNWLSSHNAFNLKTTQRWHRRKNRTKGNGEKSSLSNESQLQKNGALCAPTEANLTEPHLPLFASVDLVTVSSVVEVPQDNRRTRRALLFHRHCHQSSNSTYSIVQLVFQSLHSINSLASHHRRLILTKTN